MSKFIERDNGVVKGVYRNRQAGYAEEELQDDHPDVAAFFERLHAAQKPITVEELLATAEKKGRLPTRSEVLAERPNGASIR